MTIDHLRTAIAEQVPRLQPWEVDGLAKKLESLGLVVTAETEPDETFDRPFDWSEDRV